MRPCWRPSALGGSTSTSTWSPCMAALISLGGMKMSCCCRSGFGRRGGGFAIGTDKAVAVAVQIEAAGDEIVAVGTRARSSGKAPVLAVELDELAADGEAGQVLEEETALAAAAKRELADQLLVSGLLAGGGGDAGEQLAIGHSSRLGQPAGGLRTVMTLESRRLHRKHGVAVEWGCASSWRSRKRVDLAEPED